MTIEAIIIIALSLFAILCFWAILQIEKVEKKREKDKENVGSIYRKRRR